LLSQSIVKVDVSSICRQFVRICRQFGKEHLVFEAVEASLIEIQVSHGFPEGWRLSHRLDSVALHVSWASAGPGVGLQ